MITKCLLSNFEENNSPERMKRHYTGVHKVHENNEFFINLLKPSVNVFYRRKCLRCDDFLLTTHFKKVYDFLLHYGSGKNVFEEKPLHYTTIGETQKNKIIFSQHWHDYDFCNSESFVDDFLWNVKNRVKRSEHGDFIIKYGFWLENIQPSPFENEDPIVSSHWSTEPFQIKLFNDYIYFSLRVGILKRVIILDTINQFFC